MGSDHEDSDSGKGPEGLLEQYRKMDIINYIGVEDFADELSYKWTSCLLTLFCTIITMKTYFLQPVACFVPSPVGFAVENQMEYVNSYCWTEGTYSVHPGNFSLRAELHDGGVSNYADSKIVYYQWVPIVLAVQAALFYLPRLLWHIISYDRAGTDVGHMVRVVNDAVRETGERHEKMVNHASRMLHQMLEKNHAKGLLGPEHMQNVFIRAWRVLSVAMPAKFSGSWLILTYLFIKLVYLGNVLSQLGLMRQFLGIQSKRYDLFGAQLLWEIAHGRDWQVSKIFPRIGCCAVFLRTAATGNWHFAQCILPVNMINEKVYIFLWFWFVFVSAATLISLMVWLFRVCHTSCGNHFVNRMLKLSDNYDEAKKNEYVRAFCHRFLRRDGTFVLKMIALNCGDIVCSEIVHRLWILYRDKKGLDHSQCDLSGVLKLHDCKNEPDGHCCEPGPGDSGLRHRRAATNGLASSSDESTSSDVFRNASAPPLAHISDDGSGKSALATIVDETER